MVAATREEPGVLSYQRFLSTDGTMVHVYQRYVGTEAAVAHWRAFLQQCGQPCAKLVDRRRFTVSGTPSPTNATSCIKKICPEHDVRHLSVPCVCPAPVYSLCVVGAIGRSPSLHWRGIKQTGEPLQAGRVTPTE
jgi:hypothetical protein